MPDQRSAPTLSLVAPYSRSGKAEKCIDPGHPPDTQLLHLDSGTPLAKKSERIKIGSDK